VDDSMPCARGTREGSPGPYCSHCDLLVGLDGLHVIGVDARARRLTEVCLTQCGSTTPGVVTRQRSVHHYRQLHRRRTIRSLS